MIDLGKLDRKTRINIFTFAVRKHGKSAVMEALRINHTTFWHYRIPRRGTSATSAGLVSESPKF